MPQYNLNGVDHIDIIEILQNSTLEQVIEIVNQNFLSLSQIADINFIDFITKKVEQRISKGDISTNNIGKPGRSGAVVLDDTIKKSIVSQGSEFISFNKFGRSVFLTIHLIDSVSGTQFTVPDKFLPIISNNIIETKLLSTEEGTLIYNSETNKISKSGNFSGDIVLTYLAKHSSTELSTNESSDLDLSEYATQKWVIENFIIKDSGIESNIVENIELSMSNPHYYITDGTADNLEIISTYSGYIDKGELTTDKAVKITNSGTNVITVSNVEIGIGVTCFFLYDLDTDTVSISTTLDPIIPDYSDITVNQISTTAVALKLGTYYKILDANFDETSNGNLIFINNESNKTYIGVYQALEGAGSGSFKAKLICAGVKLNTVRHIGGKTYISEYDGSNISSLVFGVLADKVNEADIIGNNATKSVNNATHAEKDNIGNVIDEFYQPKESTSFETNDNTVVGAINEVNSIAKGAQQSLSENTIYNAITAINAFTSGQYNIGQNMLIVQIDVPDLWLSTLNLTSVPYTYVSDSQFISDVISGGGSLQVGYYNVSFLENNKIDLTNYYTKSQTNALLSGKQNTLTFSTDIEADKASTTKVSAIKTFYDWAVGLFAKQIGDNIFSGKQSFDGMINHKAGEYFYTAISKTADTVNDIRTKNYNGVKLEELCIEPALTKGDGIWVLIKETQKINYITATAGGGTYNFTNNTTNNLRTVKLLSGTHNFIIPAPTSIYCDNECYVTFVIGTTIPTINRILPEITGGGKATFTNNSAVVTFTDTDATRIFKAGKVIRDAVNNLLYTILTVDNATQVTLTANATANSTSGSYKYVPVLMQSYTPTSVINTSVDESYVWEWNGYAWTILYKNSTIVL